MPSKKSKLALTLPIALLFIIAIGVSAYFFANNKNQPKYLTSIDKLMFDTKNKAPKFLLTLPDKKRLAEVKSSITLNQAEQEEEITKFDSLRNIPSIAKLPKITNKQPLKAIYKKPTNEPWSFYAKPYSAPPNFYKIAIVLKDIGLNKRMEEEILQTMPENVSLSFSPYAKNLEESVAAARESGHETYLDLLFATNNILYSDRGPKSLLPNAETSSIIKQIKTYLDKDVAVSGFVTSTAIEDVQVDPNKVISVLDYINDNGMLFIDATGREIFSSVVTKKLPRYKTDIIIDQYSKEYINQQFAQAEQKAIETGSAVIVIYPKPVVLVELLKWVKTFSKPQKSYEEQQKNPPKRPFALVPLSAMAFQ